MTFKLPVVAALAAVLVAGPAFAAQHYTVVASNPSNGATIKIPNGDELLLKLTACETCGYQWKVMQKPNSQVVVFDKRLQSTRNPGCSAPCTGGTSTERFQFSSKSVGSTTVKLGYFGPAKSKPSKVKTLDLAVTA